MSRIDYKMYYLHSGLIFELEERSQSTHTHTQNSILFYSILFEDCVDSYKKKKSFQCCLFDIRQIVVEMCLSGRK